ncbi:MAG: zinc-binding dehydrogenase [Chloroflexi bacterium]|nr:zinc-binding dehydrogenase [Chloroflexota bacterium]
MKAVQLVAPQQLKFVELPAPVPSSGQVLVRMDYLAVCGSDLKFYERNLPDVMYPMGPGRPCHECVGTVEVSTVPEFKPGDRVIALIQTGGMVESAVLPAELLVPLPDAEIDPALWVLCQPMGTVMYSVHRIGSVLGKRVVVVGAGPIGLCFTDLMVRHGARQVITTDVHTYRLETAARLGATHTIDASRENVAERVSEITGGEMADVAIEACGLSETYQQVFDVIRKQGTVAIFGVPHLEDRFSLQWDSVYNKLPTIIVTNSAQAGERTYWVALCVDLVAQGRLDLSYLATHQFSWDEVPAAFDFYSTKKDGALKCVIHVRD